MKKFLFAKLIMFTAIFLSLVMLVNSSANGLPLGVKQTFVTAYALDDEDDDSEEIIGYDDFTPDEDEEDMRYVALLPSVFVDGTIMLDANTTTGVVDFSAAYEYGNNETITINCKFYPPEDGYENLSLEDQAIFGPRFTASIVEHEYSIASSTVITDDGGIGPTICMGGQNYYTPTYSDSKPFTNLLQAIILEDAETLEQVLENPYQDIDFDPIGGGNLGINADDDESISVMSLSSWLTSLFVIAVVIVTYVIVTQVAEQIQAEKNLEFNTNLETLQDGRDTIDGLAYGVYIDNQHTSTPANYQFGFTTFDNVGCEVAAIYNLMIDLGQPQMLSQVINDFEKCAIEYAFGWGCFGSEPRKLYRYLSKHGISYKKYTSYKKYKKAVSVTDSDHYISSFWNSTFIDGLHTFYIRRTLAVTGETTTPFYTPYNHDFDDATTSNFDDFKNSYSSFIIGYIILA